MCDWGWGDSCKVSSLSLRVLYWRLHFIHCSQRSIKEAMMHNKNPKCTPERPKRPSPSPAPMPRPKQRGQEPSPQSPPNVTLDEGPSINARTYRQDRLKLEAQEETVEQPDAFSSGEGQSSMGFGSSHQEPKKK